MNIGIVSAKKTIFIFDYKSLAQCVKPSPKISLIPVCQKS